jgi:hypothetical protein
MSERDLQRIRKLLAKASAAISQNYFMLPVAHYAGEEPLVQYRERVYAYELYHQLRVLWPDWKYSLAGEVDKSGHPVIRGGELDKAKPDLLIHVPGQMDGNLLVVEIKASPSAPPPDHGPLQRDLKKLCAFRKIGYAGAVFLVFGDSVDRVREAARREQVAIGRLEEIGLWHHARPNEPAKAVQWEG